jgi:K+-transporting ATPase KdpF subunit
VSLSAQSSKVKGTNMALVVLLMLLVLLVIYLLFAVTNPERF